MKSLGGGRGWGLKKEGSNKKDERDKFIKREVYVQNCRYTAKME
jgi:hypothetical protein